MLLLPVSVRLAEDFTPCDTNTTPIRRCTIIPEADPVDMHSDMRGIIEEQRVSRRKPRAASDSRATVRGYVPLNGPDGRSRTAETPWVTNGSAAPVLSEFQQVDEFQVERLEQLPLQGRPTEPFVPSSTAPSLTGAFSIAGQRPARRRSDRLWLRRFVRPRRNMTSVLLESQRGAFTGIPACYLAPVIALPLALVALATLLNTVVASRPIIAERLGVEMPVMTDAALLLGSETPRIVGDGVPLSIDPSEYEKIRRAEYVVQPGDTISEIADGFDLDTGTILSMNPVDDVRRLLPGTILSIPNRDGLFHMVQPGDSLSGIADSYGTSVSAVLDANDVESSVLHVGDNLFIPGAFMSDQDLLLAIGELFRWPVRRFTFTSGFGMRVHPISGTWQMHAAIDLANQTGTPILAAGSGRIVHVENQPNNYGKMIIIDHGNGYRSLYAHLDTFGVSWGDYVVAEEQIGTMGSTGRSTGPHLHFSVFRGSQPIDPLSQLGDR